MQLHRINFLNAFLGLVILLPIYIVGFVSQPSCRSSGTCTSVLQYGLTSPLCLLDATCIAFWHPPGNALNLAGYSGLADEQLAKPPKDLRYLAWSNGALCCCLGVALVGMGQSLTGMSLADWLRRAGLAMCILEPIRWMIVSIAILGTDSLGLILIEGIGTVAALTILCHLAWGRKNRVAHQLARASRAST